MTKIFGDFKSREEVLSVIKADFETYCTFLEMKPEFREQFLEFCTGIRGVKMSYDPFFKHIFDAGIHPERLAGFLSQIIGEPVKVKAVLPKEHRRISEKGSLLIMDIIVELESGEMADVEIQKMGYHFPGQRAACYSSDMVMRQYERVRSRKGKDFSYKDLKKVYTIVIMEKSSKVISSHPKFEQMYEEINYFRYHPEEAIRMFSEALRILDENTVKYMIEELEQELEEKDLELEEKDKKLEEKDKKLEEKDKEIERLKAVLAGK